MRPPDCLPDPESAGILYSFVDVPVDDAGQLVKEGIAEYVFDSNGAIVAQLTHDTHWPTIRSQQGGRTVDGQCLYLPSSDVTEDVVVKKRPLVGLDRTRWQTEIAAYDTSRLLHEAGRSLSEDVNLELARRGHPGRVPDAVLWWVDQTDEPWRGAIALTRLAGMPLQDLLRHYPEGLPPVVVAAIMRSACLLVDAAHAVGVRVGDISLNNLLVVGDLSDAGTIYVNLVDLELMDLLASPDRADRDAWLPLVDGPYRWRVATEGLSKMVGYTGPLITYLHQHGRLGFETDLGYLGVVTRAALTGSTKVDDEAYQPDVPDPLRWLIRQFDRTGTIADRIRDGRAPELACARALGDWLDRLTPREAEPDMTYLARIEAAWSDAAPGLLYATFAWADRSTDPTLRLVAARLAASTIPGRDPNAELDRWLRTSAQILSAVLQSVAADEQVVRSVAQAGLLTGSDLSESLLASIVQMLTPADRVALERVERIWPGLAPHAPNRRPTRSSDRQPFLSGDWLDQLVAHAPLEAPEGVEPGRYCIKVENARDRSFTVVVDDDGRLGSLEFGTSRLALATTVTSAATLADHLDGTAYLPDGADHGSPWLALWTLVQVAPPPAIVTAITTESSWPARGLTKPKPARIGTSEWLEELVASSAHRITEPTAAAGDWSIVVVDDPGSSFTYTVSEDRRLSGCRPGTTAPEARATPVRRQKLTDSLRTRPAQSTPDALSVLCRLAGDVDAFTDEAPPRREFLTSGWLTEVLCRSTTRRAAERDAGVLIVPEEDPSLAFEVGVTDGVLTRLRPWADGDLPDDLLVDLRREVIPAGRLWDVLVEALPCHLAVGGPTPGLELLASVRPADAQAFTAPSPRLGCPPGETARRRSEAEHRELRRQRQRKAEANQRIVSGLDHAAAQLARRTLPEGKRLLEAVEADARMLTSDARDVLADVLLERDRLYFGLEHEVSALIDEIAEEYGEHS